MCGIAGILRVHPPGQAPPPPHVAIPESWLDILDDSVKHRGPDGQGRFRDRAVRPDGSTVDVAFVHRRLSIIDHAGGHQPMVLPGGGTPFRGVRAVASDGPGLHGRDPEPYRRTAEHALNPCPRCAALGRGTIAVVFNGCIYNHRELRRELEAAGHVFSTDHSDTEVLVHGLREWRNRLGEQLEGMYAFVGWDHSAADVCLARDTALEKPLFVVEQQHLNAFCSVPAGLARWLASRRERIRVNDELQDTWIRFGASDDPAVNGVSRWPFPSIVEISWDRSAYARRMTEPPERGPSGALGPEQVESVIDHSVSSRLDADVPLACFLSGGIDSSLVAHFAQKATGRLRTLCVRMNNPQLDESDHASRVAALIGTDHATLECHTEPSSDLPRLIVELGLPFGDSSLLPAYWVSKAARTHARVALSGDGGDELFCGYERHTVASHLKKHGRLIAAFPRFALPDRIPGTRASKIRRLIQSAREGYDELLAIFPMPELRRLTRRPWHRAPRFYEEDPAGHDFRHYLAEDLLCKTDTASMSVALEVRSPLLSRPLIQACLSAPYADLMPHGQRKGLLRAVARKYFPPEIVDRPKQGFAIPIGEWFRSDYGGLRQLLLDHLNGPEPFGPDHLGINAMINMGFVRQMLREHDDAGSRSIWPWKGRDHSQRLYMMLVLSIWAKWLGSL